MKPDKSDRRHKPRIERRWRNSLYFRILVASFILFGTMAAIIALNSQRIIEKTMLENIRVSEQQTSEILNLAVSPYAISGDFSTLQIFLDELLNTQNGHSGLVYLVICREDGTRLLQSGLEERAPPAPDGEESYLTAIQRGIVHIRRPLLLENNMVGFLQYGLSFRLIKEATERLNRETTLLVILGLAVTAGVLLLMTLKIVQRINTLAKASQDIARGDYSRRTHERGADEISLLSANFNDMADAIEQRIQEVTFLNRDLESRVEERTQELRELNTTLQQTVDDLKWTQENLVRSEKLAGLGSLVAGVAHELNTPIGNALTVATTLQDNTQGITDEFRSGLKRASLENFLVDTGTAGALIVRNLQRAADLITSFKHVAVDQTSENCREFELRTTVEDIIATLAPTLKKTPYRIEVSIPPGIVFNSYPGALGQIITNLINNAIFHGFSDRDHGLMRLSATALQGNKAMLTFEDDGKGMAPETLKRIFDPFFTTRLGQGGSGLGMNIVHNLVTGLLKGSIVAQSIIDKGTQFTIILPLVVA
ncbi:MAG: ATP-binding protein [Gammaproteobacteria bacterium]